jgi:parvulin-like peptidyl-prolyl isomerase
VVATVDGRPIDKAQLEQVLRQTQIQLNATRPDVPITRFKVLDGAVHQLVERALMHELADKLGAKPDPEYAKAWLADLEGRMAADESFAAFLLRAGKDPEARKRDAEEEAIDHAIVETIRQQVRSELDSEAKAYYDRNKKQYLEYEGREVWRLFVKAPRGMVQRDRDIARTRVEGLLAQAKKLKKADDFENLVKSNSEGGKGREGGYIGWVARKTFAKELEDQIYAAKVNTILPIYEDAHGYYIYWVGKHRPERQVPFEEVREQILDQVFRTMIDKEMDKRLEGIRKQAKVEIHIPELIELKKQNQTPTSAPKK